MYKLFNKTNIYRKIYVDVCDFLITLYIYIYVYMQAPLQNFQTDGQLNLRPLNQINNKQKNTME